MTETGQAVAVSLVTTSLLAEPASPPKPTRVTTASEFVQSGERHPFAADDLGTLVRADEDGFANPCPVFVAPRFKQLPGSDHRLGLRSEKILSVVWRRASVERVFFVLMVQNQRSAVRRE